MVVLRKPQVLEKLGGLSTSGLANLINKDGFPKPFYLGGRLAAWDEADVDMWLNEKKMRNGGNNGTGSGETESNGSSQRQAG